MIRLLAPLLLLSSLSLAKCIPFESVADKIDKDACVSGKVVKVEQLRAGHYLLNFCEEAKTCAFSVIVFRDDLRDVGDVQQLQGKDIEIHGRVKEYRGHAEIILKDVRQLHGEAARIPPLPKTYDVSRHGRYSAGSFYGGKTPKQSTARSKKRPADPIEEIEPGMEQ